MSFPQNTHTATTAYGDSLARNHVRPSEQRPDSSSKSPSQPLEHSCLKRINVAAELLDGALARGWGERVALRLLTDEREITCTYSQLAAQVNRIVRVLRDKLGLVPGRRVLLSGPNHPMLAAIFLAVLKAGLVAVATPPRLRARELKAIIDKAHVSVALCDARLGEELDKLSVPSSDFYASPPVHTLYFNSDAPDALEARAAHVPIALVVDTPSCPTLGDDVALIAFAPGAARRPKSTVHFHRDILVMSNAFPRHVLKPNPDDIFCGTTSVAFPLGLGGLLTMPLCAGASVLLTEQLSPEALLGAARRVQATVMVTTPTMYQHMALLLKDGKVVPAPSLRCCVSVGATRADAKRSLWRETTGIEVINV